MYPLLTQHITTKQPPSSSTIHLYSVFFPSSKSHSVSPFSSPKHKPSIFNRHSLSISGFFLFMASFALPSDTNHKGLDGGQDFLQKHVAFFDRNNDGIVYPWETFQGFRAIGASMLLSTVASLFINMGLSSRTRPGKWPSPLFPIEVKNIAIAKHGSDSGVYDAEGRFVPSKFEEIFRKHAHTHPNALTSDELSEMLRVNREPNDYVGWIAALSEWKILFYLCKDNNDLLQKQTVRGVYDGSLFEQMEKERQSAKKKDVK